MDTQRKDQRVKLSRYVGIYDQQTSRLVGHVVNLSKSGLMITGHRAFNEGQKFSFWTENELNERLPFEAVSRWNSKSNDHFNNTGFEFAALPKKTKATFSRYL